MTHNAKRRSIEICPLSSKDRVVNFAQLVRQGKDLFQLPLCIARQNGCWAQRVKNSFKGWCHLVVQELPLRCKTHTGADPEAGRQTTSDAATSVVQLHSAVASPHWVWMEATVALPQPLQEWLGQPNGATPQHDATFSVSAP